MSSPGTVLKIMERWMRSVNMEMMLESNSWGRSKEDWRNLFEGINPGLVMKSTTTLQGSRLTDTELALRNDVCCTSLKCLGSSQTDQAVDHTQQPSPLGSKYPDFGIPNSEFRQGNPTLVDAELGPRSLDGLGFISAAPDHLARCTSGFCFATPTFANLSLNS